MKTGVEIFNSNSNSGVGIGVELFWVGVELNFWGGVGIGVGVGVELNFWCGVGVGIGVEHFVVGPNTVIVVLINRFLIKKKCVYVFQPRWFILWAFK